LIVVTTGYKRQTYPKKEKIHLTPATPGVGHLDAVPYHLVEDVDAAVKRVLRADDGVDLYGPNE
jgi:hypothetical protein